MNLNGTEYFYVRNAQGDIIGLIDGDGVRVVSYAYDSWGKLISIKHKDGKDVTTDKTHVGYKNPYRYRGYRYDNETSLYYLQSRYYNSEWGRFINEDGLIGKTGDLLGRNLFAYCENNAINGSDPTGFMVTYADVGGTSYFVYMPSSDVSETVSEVSNSSGSEGFNYKESAIKGTKSGVIDSISGVVTGKVMKERKVWKPLGTWTLGSYVSNLGKGAKLSKKALGIAGTIGFTAWDVGNSIIKGEYVGAGIDILSVGTGVGAGIGLGVIGGFAIAIGTPVLLVSGVSFVASIGIGVLIDYVASNIKNKYYRR